jgi:hypothetical protein
MSSSVSRKDIAGGYFVAAAILCLGYYFGMQVEGSAGTMLVRGFYVLAGLVVLKVTFAWGRIRGFAAKGDDDRIVFSHVLRILVMAAIVSAALLLLTAPMMMLAFKLTR